MKRNIHVQAEQTDVLAEEALMSHGNGPRESVVIIPTYNEALNLTLLIPTILRQGPFDILIIDDNSPDGTGEVAEELAKRFAGRVSVLHRPGKLGLGSAYIEGFRYALAKGYTRIFTMDADFSHDPSSLSALRAALDDTDVVLGSRYIPGGGTLRWPFWRRVLSQSGSAYARLILGLPIRDLTGGFKGFRRQVLEALLPELEMMRSRGYAFQIEMTYRCARHGFRIVEVPILFEDRLVGKSKMNRGIVAEALWVVWALRLSQGAAPLHTDARPRARLVRQRLIPAALALALFLIILVTVTIAPAWFLYLVQRGSVQMARNQVRSASSVDTRPVPSTGIPRPVHKARSASLQLQGTDLTPNVPLRFAGSGFLPGEALAVTIQDQAGQQEVQLALLSADQAGQISLTAEAIPSDLSPGVHTLLVEGQSSQHVARATFQLHWIPPTVQLDTYAVKPERDVGFAGSGFLPNEVVEVRLGTTGQVVATASANAGGNVAGRFTVPFMPEGTYTLFFEGHESQTPTSVGLNVQGFHPWVILDTYAPSPHGHLGFMGEDFAPGEEVLVYLNRQAGEPVVRMHADATGRFVMQATWEVGELSGKNTLIFVGQQSGAMVTTTFTVLPSVVSSTSPTS
jgi:dolichol-phosphate mannosyltransferase